MAPLKPNTPGTTAPKIPTKLGIKGEQHKSGGSMLPRNPPVITDLLIPLLFLNERTINEINEIINAIRIVITREKMTNFKVKN